LKVELEALLNKEETLDTPRRLTTRRTTMTDRKDALIELLAKVEAGEAKPRDFTKAFIIHPNNHFCYSGRSYKGSLDAAKALHKAVLQGNWGFKIVEDGCDVFNRDAAPVFSGYCHENPSRAWLIAILKALIQVD
jgi:hypothetical protein